MYELVHNQTFPCISQFKKLSTSKYAKVYLYDVFKKTSFHNRYVLAGANGLINLTIPISGGREQRVPLVEVKIANTGGWQISHWRTIYSSYKKAAFFDYYEEEIKTLIFNSEPFLYKYNLSALSKIIQLLKLDIEIEPARLNHLDITEVPIFEWSPVNFQNNTENWFPKYSQVFEERLGFQPNLSILDLLFCQGPNAKDLLINSTNS